MTIARDPPPLVAHGSPGEAPTRPIGLDSSPLHGELLGVERLEERARALAAEFTLARDPRRGPPRLLRHLDEDVKVLRSAYRALAGDVRRGEPGAPAAEWLLDNFHLIEGELREIRRNLPTRYYLQLPKLAARGRAGTPRVYAMAVELLRYSDARLDAHRLDRFMNAYQTVAPLTIGELWAWPSMLKLALIVHLRRLSEELLESRAGRHHADRCFAAFEGVKPGMAPPPLPAQLQVAFVDQLLQRMREYGSGAAELRKQLEQRLEAAGTTVEDAVRAEHQRQAMNHLSMGNSITSLRLCSSARLERLRREREPDRADPAGAIRRRSTPAWSSRAAIAIGTRSRSWPSRAVKRRYAWRCGRWRAHARRPEAPGTDARAAHVGYHLIGGGRRDSRSTWRIDRHCCGGCSASLLDARHQLLPRCPHPAHRAGRRGRRRGGPCQRRATMAVGLGRCGRADPGQRVRRGAHAAHRSPAHPSRRTATAGPARGRARGGAHAGDRAHDHHVGRRCHGPGRAPRGARAGQS